MLGFIKQFPTLLDQNADIIKTQGNELAMNVKSNAMCKKSVHVSYNVPGTLES